MYIFDRAFFCGTPEYQIKYSVGREYQLNEHVRFVFAAAGISALVATHLSFSTVFFSTYLNLSFFNNNKRKCRQIKKKEWKHFRSYILMIDLAKLQCAHYHVMITMRCISINRMYCIQYIYGLEGKNESRIINLLWLQHLDHSIMVFLSIYRNKWRRWSRSNYETISCNLWANNDIHLTLSPPERVDVLLWSTLVWRVNVFLSAEFDSTHTI